VAPHEPDLAAYRRKRHPGRTPEPEGEAPARGGDGEPIFVVQRHSARRLHFDLRLEAGGVLRSWAVPKGLPTIRGRRRLAVHTEDHPMAYATFSGRIPEGEYGAGTVDVYDHGTYELLEVKRDGGLTFRLHGERLDGVWTLVPAHLDGEERNWLLLPKGAPERDGALPRVAPMAACPATNVPGGAGWVHEIKWDGYRALARLDDGEPELWSRGGRDLGERFPRVLADLGRGLRSPRCVVDGEVVAFRADGTPSFNLLQRAEGTISYLVFDVLELEGEDVCGRPLDERRELLEALVDETSATVRISRTFADGGGLLAAARERGLEGVISKRRSSAYRPGRRSRDWLHVKATLRGWFPVIGLRPGTGSRTRLGSVVVGRAANGELTYAGRVGSGLSEAEIDRVLEALEPLVRDAPPVDVPRALRAGLRGVRWLEPAYEAEVEYAELSADGILRHPRYHGLRER
jgi:bifunctional non-homologous end joining protein LigD